MKRRQYSRKKGSVAALGFVAVVPLVAALTAFGVDCMHVNDASGELQRATDAAALAGSEDLGNYVGNKALTAQSVSSANEEPVNFALSTASLNAVDGPLGLWQGGQRSVSATIRYDSTLAGPVNRPNRCDVTGTIQIKSVFAQVFGNFSQTVTTNSSAGLTSLNTLYSFAPLLVSEKDPDPSGRRLKDLAIDSIYTVGIKSNDSSNSVWILNSNQDDIDAIMHIADPENNPGNNVPAYSIGDVIKSDNGQKSAGQYFDKLVGKDVPFLVTNDSVDGDYLAKGQPVHTVVGFMVLHVTGYDNKGGKDGYSLTGNLRPVSFAGGYDPTKGTGTITTFAPFLSRLIQ